MEHLSVAPLSLLAEALVFWLSVRDAHQLFVYLPQSATPTGLLELRVPLMHSVAIPLPRNLPTPLPFLFDKL